MKDTFHLQWHITNLCNLRCQHCYQDDFSKQNELDWRGLKRVSDNILTTIEEWDQTACIHLAGGEPLLKSELFPLLNVLNQQSVVEELGIITNGLLLDQETVNRLSSITKLKKIKISLDGATPELNDSIRSPGTFERVMKNIGLLQGRKEFELIFMFTVMKRNYWDLLNFIHLCEDLEVAGLIIERFIPWGRGRALMDEVLGQKEWKETVEGLRCFFSIENNSCLSYQAFQIRFKDEEPELLGAPCVIGTDGLCLMPNGDVFPCRRFPISIGNLLSAPLKRIWEESGLLAKLRRKEGLQGRCGKCEIEDCRGCRSLALALTGDYLAEDPHCLSPKPFSSF